MWTSGGIQLQFPMYKAPFDSPERRIELATRLNQTPGITIPQDGSPKYPSLNPALLEDEKAIQVFLSTFDWMLDTILAST